MEMTTGFEKIRNPGKAFPLMQGTRNIVMSLAKLLPVP
jgi:hypothetical protein